MRNPDLKQMDFHRHTINVWAEIGEWFWMFSGMVVVILAPLFIFAGIMAVIFDVKGFTLATFAFGVVTAFFAIYYTLYLQVPLIVSNHRDHEIN